MSLVTSQELLEKAQREGFAIGGFNIMNLEMMQGVLEAAEEERSPVILSFNPGSLRHLGLELAAAMAKDAARRASVPVVLHLDHALDFPQTASALRAGFTALMYDGTRASFEDNVAVTRQVCQMAHAVGVPVEGEMGMISGREDEIVFSEGESLTDPEEARRYVDLTEVDSLAIAVGNVHGMTAKEARLDLPRITAIREKVEVPLVLHGASGVPEDEVREAIARGICKFNVATQLNQAFLRGLQENPGEADLRRVLATAREEVKATARALIQLFGSNHKA